MLKSRRLYCICNYRFSILESSTEWESLLEKSLILTNQHETYEGRPNPPSQLTCLFGKNVIYCLSWLKSQSNLHSSSFPLLCLIKNMHKLQTTLFRPDQLLFQFFLFFYLGSIDRYQKDLCLKRPDYLSYILNSQLDGGGWGDLMNIRIFTLIKKKIQILIWASNFIRKGATALIWIC